MKTQTEKGLLQQDLDKLQEQLSLEDTPVKLAELVASAKKEPLGAGGRFVIYWDRFSGEFKLEKIYKNDLYNRGYTIRSRKCKENDLYRGLSAYYLLELGVSELKTKTIQNINSDPEKAGKYILGKLQHSLAEKLLHKSTTLLGNRDLGELVYYTLKDACRDFSTYRSGSAIESYIPWTEQEKAFLKDGILSADQFAIDSTRDLDVLDLDEDHVPFMESLFDSDSEAIEWYSSRFLGLAGRLLESPSVVFYQTDLLSALTDSLGKIAKYSPDEAFFDQILTTLEPTLRLLANNSLIQKLDWTNYFASDVCWGKDYLLPSLSRFSDDNRITVSLRPSNLFANFDSDVIDLYKKRFVEQPGIRLELDALLGTKSCSDYSNITDKILDLDKYSAQKDRTKNKLRVLEDLFGPLSLTDRAKEIALFLLEKDFLLLQEQRADLEVLLSWNS